MKTWRILTAYNMNKNKQKTITVLVLIVLLNILLLGVYFYAFSKVKIKNEEASVVSEELNDYLSKEGTVNLLKALVKKTSEDRIKLDSYFVSRDNIPEFTKEIEALGKMSGTDVTIKGLQANGNVLMIEISSEGNFRNTLQLVSLIESLPFKVEVTKAYLDVTEVEIPEEEGGGVRVVWNGNFNIDLTGFIVK